MRNIVNAILLQNGKILLARRSAHRQTYADCWSFPGGHVEFGETQEQALNRELREELGITPLDYRFITRIADPITTDKVFYHLYAVYQWEGSPAIIGDEHSELCWFTFEKAGTLKDLALDAYHEVFEILQKHLTPDVQATAQ